jgi:hypothetical protein
MLRGVHDTYLGCGVAESYFHLVMRAPDAEAKSIIRYAWKESLIRIPGASSAKLLPCCLQSRLSPQAAIPCCSPATPLFPSVQPSSLVKKVFTFYLLTVNATGCFNNLLSLDC